MQVPTLLLKGKIHKLKVYMYVCVCVCAVRMWVGIMNRMKSSEGPKSPFFPHWDHNSHKSHLRDLYHDWS